MSSEIALNQDFKEKLFEKIQSDIGSLLGEEELKALVASAFERAFFQERRVPKRYGSDEIQPPLIQELVEKALYDKVDAIVRELVNERSDEILAMANKVIEGGASKAFLNALDTVFSCSMDAFKQQIMSDVMNRP